MKILFITESFPYPLNNGGKIVSHQMLTMLAVKHDVTLLALTDKKPAKRDLMAIASLGVAVNFVITKKRSPWYRLSKTELLHALLHGKPPAVYPFYEEMLTEKLNSLLKKMYFDVIHIDHLSMAQYLPKAKTTRWVLQEHNIEYKLYKDFNQTSQLFSKEQLLYFCNYLCLSWYERKILKTVDQIIVLSQYDQDKLTNIGIARSKILIIPPYVQKVSNRSNKKNRNKELLFIGNLWWKPNLDAISWFLKDIFPLVQQRDPSIALTIIGEGTKLLNSFVPNHPSMNLIEKPHDITPYLKRASVFIMPFRIGQGVRIKALTAFSFGLPVVSTGIGMHGLETVAGREYLAAETPAAFAKKILTLIYQSNFQTGLIASAQQLLLTKHGPALIRHQLLKHYARSVISV